MITDRLFDFIISYLYWLLRLAFHHGLLLSLNLFRQVKGDAFHLGFALLLRERKYGFFYISWLRVVDGRLLRKHVVRALGLLLLLLLRLLSFFEAFGTEEVGVMSTVEGRTV